MPSKSIPTTIRYCDDYDDEDYDYDASSNEIANDRGFNEAKYHAFDPEDGSADERERPK